MGDFFAFLLKARFRASEKSAEEVVAGLSPFLSRLAAAKDLSEGELISGLLCDYFEANEELITEKKLLKGVDCATAKSMKSGRLDKVSDDCLKLAMPYLDYSDRCKGVELTCHRLLQLSRAAPIHCRELESLKFNEEIRDVKVARRFQTEALTLCYNASDPLSLCGALQLTYPRLERVNFENDLRGAVQFLRRHPHIANVGVRYPSDPRVSAAQQRHFAEVLTELSNCKNVRSLDLEIALPIDFNPPEIDLSHITEVSWNGYGSGDLIQMCDLPCLFHDKLQSLTLVLFENRQDFDFLAKNKWQSLRKLELDWCHPSFWTTFAGVKMEHCSVNSKHDEFQTALCTFAASTLEIVVQHRFSFFIEPAENDDFGIDGHIKHLSIVLKKEYGERDFALFVHWLSRNVHSFGVRTTVQMAEDWKSVVENYFEKNQREYYIDENDCDSPALALLRSELDSLLPHVIVVASASH